ncbi:MAG: IPT/TIG domain-containing protein, partial [Pseudomonadota bacterium]
NQVRAFTTASGIPTAVSGNPFTSGLTQAVHGLLHPSGFYLVADRSGNRVGVYRISGSGSATTLAAVSGSPFAAGGSFTNVLALNQAGTFLFAANGDSRNLTTFGINPTSGVLTALNTQPANTLGASGRLTGMAYLPTTSTPCPTITLSPAALPAGTVGAAYNQTVMASPAGNYNFSVTAGALPAGLSLNAATGALTGAPAAAGAFNFTITALSFGPCSGSQAYTLTINNPLPAVASISPTSATAATEGGANFALTVNGSGFVNSSVVRWNGADRPTTFVSPTQVTAQLPAADLATAGTASVTVFNPAPGGGASNSSSFTINNPTPAVAGVDPASAIAGGQSFTLMVNGSNFVNGSVVRWNGADRATTFVSGTKLSATIPASDIAAAGMANVTVFNSAPGGGVSMPASFTINNPPPTLAGLNPSSTIIGGAGFTLAVTGTGFVNSSVVRWNGGDRVTTFISATQLTAAITAADIAAAGAANVTVFNPAPGGGTSSALSFGIDNPAPVLTSLSPGSTTVGGAAFTLTVSGSSFINGSVVRWNGVNRATTFVSA